MSTGLIVAEDFLVKALDGLRCALKHASTRTDGESLDLLSKSHRAFFSYSLDHGGVKEEKTNGEMPICLDRPSIYYGFEAKPRQITNEELDVLFTNLDQGFLSQFKDSETFRKKFARKIDFCTSKVKYKLDRGWRGYYGILYEFYCFWDPIKAIFDAAEFQISFGLTGYHWYASLHNKTLPLIRVSKDGLYHLTKNGRELDGDNANLKPLLHEFLEEAERFNVEVFVITDLITTILLQFDSSDGLTASLKYRVINVEDSGYPFEAVLAAVIYDRYRAVQQNTHNNVVLPNLRMKAEDEIKVRNEELRGHLSRVSFLNFQVQPDRFDTPKVAYTGGNLHYLQMYDENWARILRFQNKKVLLHFPWLGDIGSDDVVLKIFNYRSHFRNCRKDKESNVFQEYWGRVMDKFLSEVSCYERIIAYNKDYEKKTKTAKLYDYGIMHMVNNGKVQYSGFFILVSFLEQTVLVNSKEIKNIAQCGLLHLEYLASLSSTTPENSP